MGKKLTALVMIALFFIAVMSGCTGGPQDSSTADVTAGGDVDTGTETEVPEEEETPKETKPKPKLILGCG